MSKKGLKICSHPSIWNRGLRWANSVNGASTVNVPKSDPSKDVAKPQKRVIDKLMEIDDKDECLPTERQNDEMVLNQYISVSEPSTKRFRDAIDDDEQLSDSEENGNTKSKQITPNRNPFKKAEATVDILLSPTRISKENNSLVNTQSPVKKTDYNKLKKLNKFSRFARTVVPKEQSIVSRFFTPSQNPSASNTQEKSSAGNDMNDVSVMKTASAGLKSPNLLRTRRITPNAALYFTGSDESPCQSEKGADDDEFENQDTRRNIVEQFKHVLKNRMEPAAEQNSIGPANDHGAPDKTDSETNELPIVLSDDDDDDNEAIDSGNIGDKGSSAKGNWLSSRQNVSEKIPTTKKSTLL